MHDEIPDIIDVLNRGGIILYPTDTIWGLGCDATNADAVKKIKQIKHRDNNKSFLVLCESMESVKEYVEDFPETAVRLENESDKPITIIYPCIKNIPEELLAEDGSLGIRIPRFTFCKEILSLLGKPIVSTSANFSGEPSPSKYSEISSELQRRVDYVVKDFHEYETPFSGSKIVKIDQGENISIIRE